MRRLCGPTFARSTEANSEAVLTWWSEAFPARTSATPAKAQDSMESGPACSSISSQPFATYDPDTSSWRTSQPSLFGDSTPFSGRWPKSGLMLGGAVYERPTLARLMAATAGGASLGTASNWPTPTVIDVRDGRNHTAGRSNPNSRHHDGVTLSDAIRMWPTPSVADTMGGHLSRGGDRSEELLLPGMAQRLTENWATPGAGDDRGANPKWSESAARHAENGVNKQMGLRDQAPMTMPSLSGPLDPLTLNGGQTFSNVGRTLRPQLSALFVEWLMGVPLGMSCVCATVGTASVDSATLLSRNALKRRSASSGTKHSVSGLEQPIMTDTNAEEATP